MARARTTRRRARPESRQPGRPWVAPLVIILASIALRLVYFSQLNATPLTQLHRWEQTDMHYYESWAQAIAAGDWLSRTVAVPMHGWQVQLADEYLGHHPEERAALELEASRARPPSTAETRLWTKWLGEHRFYQDPLYPYLIGLTFRVVGRDVRYVFAWQLIAGVLTNVMIFLLARRFFGATVAAWSGAMAVLCGPLMYYDLILLRETLITLTGLWLVWLTDRAWTTVRAQWLWFGSLGLSIGAACLLKSTFSLLGVAIAAATVWHLWGRKALRPPSPDAPLRSSSPFVALTAAVAGLVVALAPLAGRNLALGLPPLSLASAGSMTFIASNIVDYPVEAGFAVDMPRVALLMGDTYGRPAAAVIQTLQTHDIGTFARMVWKKWEYAWLWYQIPNNEDVYYMQLQAPVLGVLPVTFWWVGSLGLVGLVLSLREVRSLNFEVQTSNSPWILYALVAATFAQLIVFYVIGRFRAPLLAALIPFAALTLVQLARWAAAWNYRALVPTAIVVTALLLWTARTTPVKAPLIRPADWLLPFMVKYQADVQRAVADGNAGRAAAAFLEYFRYEPDVGQIMATGSPQLATDLGQMHRDCADLLRQSGQQGLAQAQDAKAAELLRMGGD